MEEVFKLKDAIKKLYGEIGFTKFSVGTGILTKAEGDSQIAEMEAKLAEASKEFRKLIGE